jgi:hypothetical protein
MATQQSSHSRNPSIARRMWARCRSRARAIPLAGKRAVLMALLIIFPFLWLGGPTRQVHAAPADPSCPTWYSDGAARCAGHVTNTPTLNPPVGGVGWNKWYVCMSPVQADNFVNDVIDPEGLDIYMLEEENSFKWFGNDHNWILGLEFWEGTLALTDTWPAYNAADVFYYPYPLEKPVPNPQETPPACPPLSAPPPCSTCMPQITAFDFWSMAPTPMISGRATCPDGSVNNCPPSVGSPLKLWVDSWVNPPGLQTCQNLGGIQDLYQDVTICMWWQPHPGSALTWDFDDETVDPGTGVGTRTPAQSGIGYDPAHPVSHTFQYSSAYDPIGGCVRPCSGDMNGPNGAPAFQVAVSSEWDLYFSVSGHDWNGTRFYRSTQINLQDFGSPTGTSYFIENVVVPVPVFSYGSVTTP